MVVHLAVSYDTEQPIEPVPPQHVINFNDYRQLRIEEKKTVWRNYLNSIWSDPELPARSLRELEMVARLGNLFAKHNGRFTSFVLGQWLDFVTQAFGEEKVRNYLQADNIEIGSHSYHHLPFKPTEHKVYETITPSQAFSEIRSANDSIEKHLRVRPIGLRTPMGNVAPFGKNDHEVLEALRENGMKYVSSWLKAAQREPNPVGIAPFFYDQAGFPDILEIPGVGYYDVHHTQPTRMFVFNDENEWTLEERTSNYITLIEDALKLEKSPVFIPLVFHPWDVVHYDPELKFHRQMLEFCHKEGINVVDYKRQTINSFFINGELFLSLLCVHAS